MTVPVPEEGALTKATAPGRLRAKTTALIRPNNQLLTSILTPEAA